MTPGPPLFGLGWMLSEPPRHPGAGGGNSLRNVNFVSVLPLACRKPPAEPGPNGQNAPMNAIPKINPSVTAPTSGPFEVKPSDGKFTTHGISPLRHNFQHHPLMQLPRLAELARSLQKTNQCRYIKPGATQASAFDHDSDSKDGRSVDQVFERIEETGSWIALYNVQTDPAYAGFLKEVTDSMKPLIEKEQPNTFKIAGFIFISAPPSVTPFHIDRENNLWLQVAGRKIMNVWDHRDRHVVAGADVDDFIKYGSLANVRLKDGYRERSREFDVGPGDGVYFPSTSPHMTSTTTDWVRPGDGVSISIGVVFYTERTYRDANIHIANILLRKLRIEPRMPGEGGFTDTLKFWLGRSLVWFTRTFRGYEPSQGLLLPKE
jgi:hypothetical protein